MDKKFRIAGIIGAIIFSFDKANTMIENAIGIFSLPLGIATNFNEY